MLHVWSPVAGSVRAWSVSREQSICLRTRSRVLARNIDRDVCSHVSEWVTNGHAAKAQFGRWGNRPASLSG